MRLTLLSMACCLPSSSLSDQEYMDRISAALGITGIDATVEKVSGTDAIFNLKNINLEKLAPLYEKYGTAIAPVLFINGEMVLYGGVPSVERLVEVLGKANAPAPS